MTNKELVQKFFPETMLDYYEILRNAKRPCWFIQVGLQGAPVTEICASPKAAWAAAAKRAGAYLIRKWNSDVRKAERA